MLLKCPHCEETTRYVRSDVFGDWVVCPDCELPFAWKEARVEDEQGALDKNGANGKCHSNAENEADGG